MNYALGYTLDTIDIIGNFKYSRLKMTARECEQLVGCRNREFVIEKVFKYSVRLILDDIVYNNATFKLPISKECLLYMKMFADEQFVKQRKWGRLRNIDFYTSNYTAWQLTFRYPIQGVYRERPIFTNERYKKAISDHINSGGVYHDGKIKVINDYYDEIRKEFPTINREDIITMVKWAWRMLFVAHLNRCDTLIYSVKYDVWLLIGQLTKDSVKHCNYYRIKLKNKISYLYKLRRTKWDGYYYFGLTRSEYDDYLSQIKPTGRKKKWFKFNKKLMYRIPELANLSYNGCVCIMRILPADYYGYKYYKEELKCANPEIVLVREPLKLKDMLMINENYMRCKNNQ